MTQNPNSGYVRTPEDHDLIMARDNFVKEMPLPPNRADGAIGTVRRIIDNDAQSINSTLEQTRRKYISALTLHIYDEVSNKPRGNEDDGKPNVNPFADNRALVKKIAQEEIELDLAVNGKRAGKDNEKLEGGKYNETYKKDRWKRRFKKFGGFVLAHVGAGYLGWEIASSTSGSLGFVASGITTLAYAGAAYGTKIKTLSPKENKDLIKPQFDRSNKVTDGTVSTLEGLFPDENTTQAQIKQNAERLADDISVPKLKKGSPRGVYESQKLQILRGLAGKLSETSHNQATLDLLKVHTGTQLFMNESRRARATETSKRRNWAGGIRALGAVAVSIFSIFGANAVQDHNDHVHDQQQYQEQLDQQHETQSPKSGTIPLPRYPSPSPGNP